VPAHHPGTLPGASIDALSVRDDVAAIFEAMPLYKQRTWIYVVIREPWFTLVTFITVVAVQPYEIVLEVAFISVDTSWYCSVAGDVQVYVLALVLNWKRPFQPIVPKAPTGSAVPTDVKLLLLDEVVLEVSGE
jgi:hypothetical protein